MRENLTGQSERRQLPRFAVNMPLTVLLEERTLPGHAGQLSDRGLYFYLRACDGEIIRGDFDFMLKLPPELTLSTWCSIRGRARLVRKDSSPTDRTGLAAEILHYSVVRGSESSANPGRADQPATS